MGRIFRSPWGDFPDVVVQTTVARMQSQPAYRAAKQGNTEAAREVLGPLVKPRKVPWPFDAVIPVTQFDRDHRNALPLLYAYWLATQNGVDVLKNVYQDNVVSHTGADARTRILSQPTFAGEVEPGLRVLIVDDVASFGSTLANLRGWLEHQGAVVVGATTLAATYGGTKLKPPEAALQALRERFPRVGELASALGFTPDRFTGREVHYLSGLKQAQDLERLIELSRDLQSGRGPSQVRHDQTAPDSPRQPQQGASRREQPPAPPPHVRYRPPGMDRGPQR